MWWILMGFSSLLLSHTHRMTIFDYSLFFAIRNEIKTLKNKEKVKKIFFGFCFLDTHRVRWEGGLDENFDLYFFSFSFFPYGLSGFFSQEKLL